MGLGVLLLSLLAAGIIPGCSAELGAPVIGRDIATNSLKGYVRDIILSYQCPHASRAGDGPELERNHAVAESLADELIVRLKAELNLPLTVGEEGKPSPASTLQQSILDELGLTVSTGSETAGVRVRPVAADTQDARRGGTSEKHMLRAAGVMPGIPEDVRAGPGRILEEADFLEVESTWINIALTTVCVVCAGLAAGLTMGLVSIEPLEMAIKQRSGTPEERLQASRILPLVTQHHFLLVTLLLFNSLANEALPIFLGNLVPSWLAVILSVSLVLFFGEILPSAIFTGKGQLAIASSMAWLVYLLMFVLAPIAWPLSWLLDRVLGIEGFKRYNRAEIAALVEVQQELASEDMTNMPLHPDEVAIVNGVLQTAEKSVVSSMIPMDRVFCMERNEKLGFDTMADIMASGYSRVLVYEGPDSRNIRGYLQVKKLIILDPEDKRDIRSLVLHIPVVVSPEKSLLELLNTFQTGRSHLALVSESPPLTLEALKSGARLEGAALPLGIITLEDIIEDIIQEEIMDETDYNIENRARDTIKRFARKSLQRGKTWGRHSNRGRAAVGKSIVSQEIAASNGSRVPVVRSASARSVAMAYDAVEEPLAPPGHTERSRLLGIRRSASINRGPGRGSTIADKMMAVVANSRSQSENSEVADGGASYGTPRLGQGKLWPPKKSTASEAV